MQYQFRIPGRFCWLPLYVMLIFVFHSASSRFTTGWRYGIVPAFVVLQMIDAGIIPRDGHKEASWETLRMVINQGMPTILDRNAWRPLIHAHEEVAVYPSVDCLTESLDRSDFNTSTEIEYMASEKALPINGVYLARMTRDCKADDRRFETLVPNDRTLYVLLRNRVWAAARLLEAGATCRATTFGAVCTKRPETLEPAVEAKAMRRATDRATHDGHPLGGRKSRPRHLFRAWLGHRRRCRALDGGPERVDRLRVHGTASPKSRSASRGDDAALPRARRASGGRLPQRRHHRRDPPEFHRAFGGHADS